MTPLLPRQGGFTLVELLVVSVLGSVVTIAAAQVLISHLRASVATEGMLRVQDTWSRVQFLLDQEIQEAERITASGSTLTLTMPTLEGITDTITYSLNAGNLIRNGPNINAADGSLLPGTSSTDTLVGNVTEFEPEANTANRTVTYTLNIRDPSGFTFREAKTTGAHTRTRIL